MSPKTAVVSKVPRWSGCPRVRFFSIRNISDQARSRWGRRKPYIVLGATLCAVLLPFFWAPVFGKSETALFLQLLLFGCVYSVSYTAMKLTFILIPSLTLFVAILIFRKYPITRQRAERTRPLLAERLAAPSP